jgi:hypothetical protein
MAFEPKDNSGALFKNERREKDTHPHATGTAIIDGVEYYVSAWTKDGRKGRFQSLAFKRKDAQQRHDRDDPRTSYGDDARDLDNGTIPF